MILLTQEPPPAMAQCSLKMLTCSWPAHHPWRLRHGQHFLRDAQPRSPTLVSPRWLTPVFRSSPFFLACAHTHRHASPNRARSFCAQLEDLMLLSTGPPLTSAVLAQLETERVLAHTRAAGSTIHYSPYPHTTACPTISQPLSPPYHNPKDVTLTLPNPQPLLSITPASITISRPVAPITAPRLCHTPNHQDKMAARSHRLIADHNHFQQKIAPLSITMQ